MDNRIEKYQIVRTLGEGSFGKVKLAYHLATNSRVALKIISRRVLQKSDMQGRIEREISYLRLLRHPHIIKLYEVIKNQDEIIMVLEFAGKELFDYIVQRGRLSENEARRFFQQIISAVQYCHKHNIVHRDLKPENLLLDDKMDIKIADFGLSNIMTDGNFLKTSCGSPNYAAPEVISGRLYAGPEVDVWSCGVILYVMLVGRLPFDEESIPELFQRISQGIYTVPEYLSPEVRNLLHRILQVNPLDRITVDEIVEDAWFRIDLDPQLFPASTTVAADAGAVDERAVDLLHSQLGFSRPAIMEALVGGAATHTADEIRDAYALVHDSFSASATSLDEYMARKAAQTASNEPRARRVERPSLYGFEHLGTLNSNIAVVPQSLTPYHLAYMERRGVPVSKRRQPTPVKRSKMRWHFGIRSRSYPLDVMGEIYRALAALGAEWRIPTEQDIWTIYVRWRNGEKNSAEAAEPGKSEPGKSEPGKSEPGKSEPGKSELGKTEEVLNMTIQLYQLEQNNYLVDFKFDGYETSTDTFSQYPFLRLSTKLIMELAVNSQA